MSLVIECVECGEVTNDAYGSLCRECYERSVQRELRERSLDTDDILHLRLRVRGSPYIRSRSKTAWRRNTNENWPG